MVGALKRPWSETNGACSSAHLPVCTAARRMLYGDRCTLCCGGQGNAIRQSEVIPGVYNLKPSQQITPLMKVILYMPR